MGKKLTFWRKNSPVMVRWFSKKSNVKMFKECPKLPVMYNMAIVRKSNSWTMDETHKKEFQISRLKYTGSCLTLSFTHLVSRRVHSMQKYSPIPTSTFPHLSITKQYLLPTHKNKPQVHNYFLITPIHSCGPYYLVYNRKSVLNTYISVNFIKISFQFWKKIIITTILSMFKFQGLFSKKVC